MRTFSTVEGAFPMATSLTSHPVLPVNLDQSPPGSPTPTSASVTVPFVAASAHRARVSGWLLSAQAAPPSAARVNRSRRLIPSCLMTISLLREGGPEVLCGQRVVFDHHPASARAAPSSVGPVPAHR